MAVLCAYQTGLAPDSSAVASSSNHRRQKWSAIIHPVNNYVFPCTSLAGIWQWSSVWSSSHRQRIAFGCSAAQFRSSIGEEWGHGASALKHDNQRKGVGCKAGQVNSIGSSEWMSRATPYEVLGVSADSSEEDIKAAFRVRIKEYHPDVYQGLGDADAITQRLLRAYEILINNFEQTLTRKNLNPFEQPECVAADIFVNELGCIGRGCPYSCVRRSPEVFQFARDTGRARAVNQDAAARGEYHTQLAVGQCPTNCIHYVTPEQRIQLEEILKSVLEGGIYSSEVLILDGLISRAKFENGRYSSPKRKVKKSEQYVDWY